jgi:hypothetical protein
VQEKDVIIQVNPALTADDLFAFYERMGASFITCYIVANCEEEFYQSLGLHENEGYLIYCRDKRLYVQS